jgi:hypothetical protein
LRCAARAAEISEEDVAHEKPKGLANKEAARKAATGQAGTAKRVSEEAARKAATGRAGKAKPDVLLHLQRGHRPLGNRTFFCTNSEGAGHSGYHWVACIVDKATQSSVANAM